MVKIKGIVRNVIISLSVVIVFAVRGFSQDQIHNYNSSFEMKQEVIEAAIANYNSLEQEEDTKGFLQDASTRKSRGRAFLQSLLLPGWGQYYANSKKAMRLFIITEALTIGSYIGFTTRSKWLKHDYRTFAVTHAGVSLQGKDDGYFVDIGNFDNVHDYNEAQLRDRDLPDLYRDTDFYNWQWDSSENREKFEDLRIRSDRASNNSEFALAAIALNHLVSAIHSTLSVYKYNKKLSGQKTGLNLDFRFDGQSQTLALHLSKAL